MRVLCVESFEDWRAAARALLAADVAPEEVTFSGERQLGLLAAQDAGDVAGAGRVAGSALRVPAEFLERARRIAYHRDPSRWDRLYRVLWRAAHDGGRTFHDAADEDVIALERMAWAVHADVERVRALVRFRRVPLEGGDEWYVAFHRPLHRPLRLAAPFFTRRFGSMRWSILTPDDSAHWDGRDLSFGPGVPRDPGGEDDAEGLWRAYYATTFNPARVNPALLRAHLPRRHWETLPEARDIPDLVRGAAVRAEEAGNAAGGSGGTPGTGQGG